MSFFALGPRLFLSCPTEPGSVQVWFTDLWNYSIVPYLLEAIKEGVQVSITVKYLLLYNVPVS